VIEEALEVPLHVGEPEQHVLDAALFDLLSTFLRASGSMSPVLALDLRQ